MGQFLTQSSTLMCPHGGTVTATPSDTSVTMDGSPIVLSTDTFVIAGCSFAPGGVYSPCTQVQWSVSAQKSTANGTALLTTDSVGMCLAGGATQGSVLIQTTQSKVSGL
jgi:hypothetical protein